MSLEKPISTIKKATEEFASELASEENLEKPEFRHIESALEMFRGLRQKDPAALQRIIVILAKTKELKEKSRPDLHELFYNISEEIFSKSRETIREDLTELWESGANRQEIQDKLNKVFDKISNEVKNDPRIIKAFQGKEELLQKSLEIYKLWGIDFIETYFS